MFGVGAKRDTRGWKLVYILLMIAFPAFLIWLWERGVDTKVIKAALLPAPSTLFRTFITNLRNGKIAVNLMASLEIVVKGFLIGAFLGLLLGFLTGLIKPVNAALTIIVSVLRPIPIIAVVPVFILFMGIGDLSKASVIAVGTFWPVFLNTLSGIQNVDVKLIEVAYAYRISKWRTIFGIVLPSAVPMIFTGVRLGVSSAWMSVVAAEMIAASKGIGYLITTAKEQALIPLMYVAVLVIGLIGLLIDKALTALEKAYLKKTRGIGK